VNSQKPDIRFLFKPRGHAIIGASAAPGKIGNSIIRNMIHSGYEGKIFPINPKGGKVFDIPMLTSVDEISGECDLATIVVPAPYVFDAVKDCAKKHIKFLSIITSGFSEVGENRLEKEIVTYANNHGMRVLGPNIFGIYSAQAHMNATFGPPNVTPGNVAIITQSGALGIAMIGKTQVENIGLSSIISIGNKSDIDEADLIEYLVEDEQTKVIFMYMEGVKDGVRLIEVLKKATRIKPVVVIKSGRSKRGAMAAASHTGSLAGADGVFAAIMNQCGVHRAIDIQEALDWCKFLSQNTHPVGENAIIITNGGGVGVLAADACEANNIHLFDDLKTLENAFKESVPSFGSVKNPIDITGGASMIDYEKCIVDAFNHKDIHSIICLGCETSVLTGETFKKTILDIHRTHGAKKPVVYSFVGGKDIEEGIKFLKSEGVPIYSDIGQAVSCLGKIYTDYRNRKAPADGSSTPSDITSWVDIEKIKEIVKTAKADHRTFLLAHEAQAIMKAANVSIPKSILATNLKEAIDAANGMGYPVVLKIVSKDIIHKSDAGGLALDLQNEKEVIDAYEAVLYNSRRYKPDALIKGVEVAEMLKPGVETIIGGRYDASFGPVIMFGQGGIYVEVMKDIAFRAITFDKHTIAGMLKDCRSYPLLLGVRGEAKKDIDGVIEVIIKVGLILSGCKDITDIEINPLLAYDEEDGVKAVDVRILLTK